MVRNSISVTLVVQLVLARLSMAAFPDCTKAPLASNTVCNTKASYLDRATGLVSLMTTEEMIDNTVNGSPGVPRFGYRHTNGATFDDPLINQVATVVSTEARAFNNYGRAGLDFSTPNINPFRDPSSVNALLWAGYPGQSGGQAIFDIISSKVAPAGRLPVTQYPSSYATQVQMTDMNLRPGTNNPGRTYMWKLLSNAPALSTNRTDTAPLATYSIAVTNTGKVTSDHVVFLLAKARGSGQPIQQLVAYTRLHGIAPGATQVAQLNLTLASLMTVDTQGNKWLNAGTYTLMADVNARLKLTVTLTGNNAQLQQWPKDPTTVAAPLDTSKQYHVFANGRQGCYSYLSIVPCSGGNRLEVYHRDDGSGRQRFQFTPVKGKTNVYTISVRRGRSGCSTFIGASDYTAFSCNAVAGDNGPGRQEWFVQPVPEQQGVYTVQVAGGRDTCGKYMGVASCSASDPNLVSMHASNDASGHQEWLFSAI